MFVVSKCKAYYPLLIKASTLFAIAIFFHLPVLGQNVVLNESPITLDESEKENLNRGEVILKGSKGEYVAQVIATGDIEHSWQVLTDYNNFENFLPNIVSSKIVKEDGEKIIFEQVNVVDLWLITKQFTVLVAANKTYLEKIDFEMVEGDLGNLQGRWEVEKLADNKVLITHRVTVSPQSATEEAIFYGIYESSLEETLKAIALEITKRSQLN